MRTEASLRIARGRGYCQAQPHSQAATLTTTTTTTTISKIRQCYLS